MVTTFLVFLTVTETIIFTILLLFLPAVKESLERRDVEPRAILDSSTEKTKKLDD